jgi:hypothetical protein
MGLHSTKIKRWHHQMWRYSSVGFLGTIGTTLHLFDRTQMPPR